MPGIPGSAKHLLEFFTFTKGAAFMKRNLTLCILALVLIAAGADAQSLRSSVISAGGTTATGSALTLRGTIGQPIIGGSAATIRGGFGFWYTTLGSIPATAVEGPAERPSSFTVGLPAPNPARGITELPFTFRESGTLTIVIFDASGRLLEQRAELRQDAGSARILLDVSVLRNGTYYVRATFNASSKTVPLLVVH
jgi:hypothetical protein